MDVDAQIQPLGRGKYWQELAAGDRFRSLRRTVTETDVINFISSTGMLEAIFIDATFDGAMAGRPAPGALTCCLIEGLQFQSLVQETGLAMLELAMQAIKPVVVGDTIYGLIEIKEIRATSKGGRAVVASEVAVFNQRSELVMTYSVKRLVAGRLEQEDVAI